MRRALFAVILLVTSMLLVGQETNVQTAKTAGTPKPNVTAPATKPKLTEQQKRGLSLLESAEGAAGGFEAPSRIVAYTQIARVYQTNNKKKAVDLLQQAYESLRTLQLDSPNKRLNETVTQRLQEQVLNQFISLAPEHVDGLVDQMDPTMRTAALQLLLPYYEKQKNLDRPVAILMQLAVEAEMPYGIVDDVMDKLGSANPDQIRELFLASLTSYQNHEHTDLSGSTDFASLIAKAYGKVPNESVATAIDEVLSQAKKADEKNSDVSISLGFEKGAVQFKSSYDMQLFAVLPTLEQVDPEKAKRLLKENEDVNTFASKYPGGMNSLSKNGRPELDGSSDRESWRWRCAAGASSRGAKDGCAHERCERSSERCAGQCRRLSPAHGGYGIHGNCTRECKKEQHGGRHRIGESAGIVAEDSPSGADAGYYGRS